MTFMGTKIFDKYIKHDSMAIYHDKGEIGIQIISRSSYHPSNYHDAFSIKEAQEIMETLNKAILAADKWNKENPKDEEDDD